MAIRSRHPGSTALAATAALVLVTVLARTHRTGAPPPGLAGGLPQLQLDFAGDGLAHLLGAEGGDDRSDSVPVVLTEAGGPPQPAKASRRGFSAWHHGTTKPSLRLKQKEAPHASGTSPEFLELSRPEDPLALCNWLPDQLADQLGLLHERSQPVQLWLDGRDAGVYLRSLRPGDDLAVASGRLRGTFWKGDSLGERRHLDLWTSATAWRRSGAEGPEAARALAELLAAVRAPATAASWQRLAAVFDLEAAARAAAVATLVGSIHADQAHNHVLFFDPAKNQLEALLWDANGFGIHAEPTLPIEVARHPLAERLQSDPRFVHRRNELLWELQQGVGAPQALCAAADGYLQRLLPTLQHDPEIIRLRLQRGLFTAQTLPASDLPGARAAFGDFVRARHLALLEHFGGTRVAIAPDPEDARGALVTVFGTVAVQLRRRDGQPVLSADGHSARLLWPGLSAQSFAAPQHRAADGTGVAAPHPRPAPLAYRIAAPVEELTAHNPFTGALVVPAATGPAPLPLRSIHPWAHAPAASGVHRLGPGTVEISTDLRLAADCALQIAPGTTIVLRAGAGIECRGEVRADGTAAAPITVRSDGGATGGVACIGSPSVQLAHVHFVETVAWSGAGAAPALALRGCRQATLQSCHIERASGDALVIAGGTANLQQCRVQLCAGTGLFAVGATVVATDCAVAFAQTGCIARDGASLHLRGGSLRGNLRGAVADRSTRGYPGGRVQLDSVDCADQGQCDVDADAFGCIELVDTVAKKGALAGPRVIARSSAAMPYGR